MQAWPPGGITIDLSSTAPAGCVLRVKIFPVLIFVADRLLVLLLSERGQRRRIAKLTRVVKTPHSRKIVRIKGVTLDLVLSVRSPPIRVVLTSRARLPSRGSRHRWNIGFGAACDSSPSASSRVRSLVLLSPSLS